jgi:biopolymer transport protein ExbD
MLRKSKMFAPVVPRRPEPLLCQTSIDEVAALKPAPALVVSVQPDGRVYLGRDAIELPQLEARLKGAMLCVPV